MSASMLENKFTLKDFLNDYLGAVKQINVTGLSTTELKSIHQYVNAIEAIQQTGVTDMVKYALSFGRELSGQTRKFHEALPILVCWHVRQPNAVDRQYAAILYEYSAAFKNNRRNLKDLMLGFVINSPLSPIKPYFDKVLDNVIARSNALKQ